MLQNDCQQISSSPAIGPWQRRANSWVWQRACSACGLGTLTEVEGKRDPRYAGLIVHDLRRSAIRNLMKAGVNEKVAMEISGHKTSSVFDRYHIVDTEDV